jgi:hypothetical protein
MTQDPRHIMILLCTYNGARFLPAQLASYLAQTHQNWSLWVSDDGSTDDTLTILRAFQQTHGAAHAVHILQGPQQGHAAANFLALLNHPDLPEGLVALSDQDDIWLPGKLARALRRIPAQSTQQPLQYSAQSLYIDDAGQRCGGSRPPPAAPVFATAMLQNVMAGHSMVLNPAALALTRRVGVPQAIAYHDWWLTLLVTAAGGRAICDRLPVTLYRQHGSNVLGAPGGGRAGLYRARRVFSADYGDWVAANARALLRAEACLQPENAAVLRAFLAAPRKAGLARVALLRRLGLHRQTARGTVFCWIAAFLGRL